MTLPGQKRALLLHLAGSGIRDIFLTYDEETRGNATDYDKILLCLNNHFKLKRNVPQNSDTHKQNLCWRCNGQGHFAKQCERSKGHICEKCGIKGHFKVCCRTKQDQRVGRDTTQRGRGKQHVRKNVRTVTNDSPQGGATSETPQGSFFAFCTGDRSETLTVSVENSRIDTIIDSGASCNLMSQAVLEQIQNEADTCLETTVCDRDVYTYASTEPLKVIGVCKMRVLVKETGKSTDAMFVIIPESHVTLLGRSTSDVLGILKVGLQVNGCDVQYKGFPELKAKYPEVFTGLGKLNDYQLKLHVDDSVAPVAQAVRRIPFSRCKKVIDKLDELERLDVIEKVSGPTSWVNPLVTVEKPNGDVRICLNMRQANQAITREKHPIPTMEETLQEIGNAKVFAKLDLNMAFHQIELHVDSRDITTCAGPNGLYMYKRLLFGVNMATEKFQHIIWQIVQVLPGVPWASKV